MLVTMMKSSSLNYLNIATSLVTCHHQTFFPLNNNKMMTNMYIQYCSYYSDKQTDRLTGILTGGTAGVDRLNVSLLITSSTIVANAYMYTQKVSLTYSIALLKNDGVLKIQLQS